MEVPNNTKIAEEVSTTTNKAEDFAMDTTNNDAAKAFNLNSATLISKAFMVLEHMKE